MYKFAFWAKSKAPIHFCTYTVECVLEQNTHMCVRRTHTLTHTHTQQKIYGCINTVLLSYVILLLLCSRRTRQLSRRRCSLPSQARAAVRATTSLTYYTRRGKPYFIVAYTFLLLYFIFTFRLYRPTCQNGFKFFFFFFCIPSARTTHTHAPVHSSSFLRERARKRRHSQTKDHQHDITPPSGRHTAARVSSRRRQPTRRRRRARELPRIIIIHARTPRVIANYHNT